MQQSQYVIRASGSALDYAGAAGTLPGAAAMSAGFVAAMPGRADDGVSFGNFTGGNAGWRMRLVPAAAVPNTVNLIIDCDAWTITVPIATTSEFLFCVFTRSGTTALVYVNGRLVFSSTDVTNVVTPQVAAPFLQLDSTALLAAAFYTEQELTVAEVADLMSAQCQFGLTVQSSSISHAYNAQLSMRPLRSATQAFADTGTAANVTLTPVPGAADEALSLVVPNNFGQPVVDPLVPPADN